MENEHNGKSGTVKYVWAEGTEYTTTGKVSFGAHGVFMTESDDEGFAGKTVFFPYGRIITIQF